MKSGSERKRAVRNLYPIDNRTSGEMEGQLNQFVAQTKDKFGKTRQPSENEKTPKSGKSDTSTLEARKEQARTVLKKQTFLEVYERLLCAVGASCRAVGMHRDTYNDWRRNDPDFRRACDEIQLRQCEVAEDILKEWIAKRKETGTLIFYLRSKHPDYRPSRVMIQPMQGEKSIVQLLQEAPEEDGN